MRVISENGFVRYRIDDFINTVYSGAPRKILFWDTCALLEIIRFVYRQDLPNTIDSILAILSSIEADQIYSVASELTIKEWNDNITQVFNTQVKDLEKTTQYHKMATDAIFKVMGLSLPTASISGVRFEDAMEDIAFRIINKTHFIKTEEFAQDALIRLSNHKAPAGKKSEIKDCVIWETMMALCRSINAYPDKVKVPSMDRAFFTVNTDDFADKSGATIVFQRLLLSEATANVFSCCFTFPDVVSSLTL